uniref:Crumbs cell polarity complex component 2b n=1 Tax=Sinocyclocheilus rhinocerous TaxID=307959 RepID=A0A673FM18_9TELE
MLLAQLSYFTGDNCSVNVNECESTPCENGGTCEDLINAFQCSCPAGFTGLPWGGRACDVPLTGCVSDPCQNNATCVPSLYGDQHQHTCRCPSGFHGDTCETSTTFSVTTGGYLVIEVPHINIILFFIFYFNSVDVYFIHFFMVLVLVNNNNLYLGGVPQEYLNRTTSRTGFVGCFEDLLVDSQPVLPQSFGPQPDVQMGCEKSDWCGPDPCSESGRCVDLWSDYRCDCRRPFHGHSCSEEFTSWTFSPERNRSFAAFPIMQQHAGDVSVSLWLKSRQLNGLVFQLQRENQAYLTVFLKNGSLYIAIYNSIRKASSFLTDGEKVFVAIKKEQGFILFNQMQQVFTPREMIGFEVEAGDVAYLGGLPEGENGRQWGGYFKGCLQDVRIDDTQLYMYSGSISQKPQHLSYLPRNSSNVLEGCVGDQTCKMRPCQNGGKCRVIWNDFVCSCPLNFSGKTCDTPVWCVSDPCDSGTRCVDLPDGYECEYLRLLLSKSQSELLTHSFKKDVLNLTENEHLSFLVLCVSSIRWRFPPRQCDVDLQCEHGGVCTDGSWGANCTCRPGFTGDRCEVDIDECESDPCRNGGTCVNRHNHYLCECVSDFSGEDCEDTKQQQQERVPWLMVAVPLACLAVLLAAVVLVCLVLTARKKRQSEGTYSPSQHEVAGARLEMGSVLKVPPEERLI